MRKTIFDLREGVPDYITVQWESGAGYSDILRGLESEFGLHVSKDTLRHFVKREGLTKRPVGRVAG